MHETCSARATVIAGNGAVDVKFKCVCVLQRLFYVRSLRGMLMIVLSCVRVIFQFAAHDHSPKRTNKMQIA